MKKNNILILLFIAASIVCAKTPYVILISFDGFRWNYPMHGITPNIQKIIDDGVHALTLRPSFPTKTFPNHLSIVTGMYPEHHGIITNNFRDPVSGDWYSMGNDSIKTQSKWYLGEAFWETAERNGIISASYFWPGSDLDDPSRDPTYFKTYDESKPYRERIDTVMYWLSLPNEKRPHFISIYFHDTDTFGHDYGPNSPELNNSIKRCDSLIAYMTNGLQQIGMTDSVNIIISSDHGMTEISPDRVVNIGEMLDGLKYNHSDQGPFMLINPSDADREQIIDVLKSDQKHFRFFTKQTIPEYFHFSDSPRIPEIILVADKGWSLVRAKNKKRWSEHGGNAATHGYDNNLLDMHGIFIASGPDFKSGYESGTVWNIDIYPLLAKIFNITPNPNIDGKLERIQFLLLNN